MATRVILVTGASGKQGGALIKALLAKPSQPPFKILALTRNITSPKARALAAKSPDISLIEGTLDDCEQVFVKAATPVWGVFSVQVPTPGAPTEEIQAKALVDAAIAHGAQHFVYTSVQRGINSDTDPTAVAHFASKFRAEKHLIAEAQKSKQNMTWTILQPVAFFDNLTPDFIGKAFATMWGQVGTKKMQFVSTTDIGRFAALAFTHPDQWRNRTISLAGDELNVEAAAKIFQDVVGNPMPTTFGFIGSMIKIGMREMLGVMFQWFKDTGFSADIEECRKINPEMQDFRKWLEEDSAFVKK